MKNLKLILAIALLTAFTGCINDDDYNAPDLSGECSDLTVTKQVSDITTTTPLYPAYAHYTDDDIIEGYVTTSDEGGNFYKSISVVSVDGTLGFSVTIDDYNLYTKFEPGRKVFIKMKDRYYTKDFGATIIGSLYNNNTIEDTSDDEVGRISPVEYKSVVIRSCEKVSEEDLVHHVTIAEAKSDTYLNKLVEIDNVQFTDASVGKKYFDISVNNLGSATNHLVEDASGATITFRASQYATFATKVISGNSGKIRGVMTKFGSTFQFMIRTIEDVKLTEPRILPLFQETFDTGNFPNWVKQSVIGPQVWTLNATGNPGSCADMNGYSGGAVQNEDWLISPVVDLTGLSVATLSFQTSRPFSGNALQAYVSTNYSGSGAPSAATWTLLSSANVATSATWKDSGNVSLNAVAGNSNVRIAFKYTSTSTSAPEWKVDNVKIK
jgi:hypothetical protein